MARNPLALTAERTSRALVAPQTLITATVAVALVLLMLTGASWASRDGRGLLDWGSFWASGDAANHGGDPYGVYAETFAVGGAPAPNLNPPISIYPFQFAAQFDATASRDVFVVLSLVAFTGCVAALWRAYPERDIVTPLAAFSLAGLWHTVELGQVYVPLVIAITAAWLLLRRGDSWQAGIALGCLVAIKPQFAIIAGLLLLAGHWRAALSGLGTAAVLSAIPLALEGPDIYRGWFDATPPVMSANTFPGNSALLAVAGRVDADWLGLGLTAAMLAVVALAVFVRKPGPQAVVAIGLIAALLAGPITWPGYTLLLLPLLFVFPWQQLLPALLFLFFPYALVIETVDSNDVTVLLVGSVYAWGIIVFAWLAARSWPRQFAN